MAMLIIGGGKMGMSHLALSTRYLGKSNIALCESKFLVRILFKLLGYRTFKSAETARSKLEKIDAIIIATPTRSHFDLINWAISNQYPCFVEKPLTGDLKMSESVINRIKDVDAVIQVGFAMRYVATFQLLKRFIVEKRFGEVVNYSASMKGCVLNAPPPEDKWQFNSRTGGGCLNEYGPHLIDLILFYFGSISRIGKVEFAQVFSTKADDKVKVEIEHENQIHGCLELDWCDTSKRKSVINIGVNFEFGEIHVDNSGLRIFDNKVSSPHRRAGDGNLEVVLPINVDFYLRGEEYSLEIEDFLSNAFKRPFSSRDALCFGTTPKARDGYLVDLVINNIAKRGGR